MRYLQITKLSDWKKLRDPHKRYKIWRRHCLLRGKVMGVRMGWSEDWRLYTGSRSIYFTACNVWVPKTVPLLRYLRYSLRNTTAAVPSTVGRTKRSSPNYCASRTGRGKSFMKVRWRSSWTSLRSSCWRRASGWSSKTAKFLSAKTRSWDCWVWVPPRSPTRRWQQG
jgi:hypothetical protein